MENIQNKINVPNVISFLRLLSCPVMLVLAFMNYETAFKWLLLAALISDIVDGVIARAWKLQTDFGAALDAVADICMFLCAVVGLFLFRIAIIQAHALILYITLGGFFLARIVNLLRLKMFFNSFHTIMAKVQAYAQGIFIIVLFFFGFQPFIFYPALILGLIHYAEEITILLLVDEDRVNIKGLYWLLKEGRNNEEYSNS